jgi:signal transduction histidine kinase/ActR/RegA family two-component response regulator
VTFEKWAETSRSSALVLIEGGELRSANARFHELQRGGSWRWLSGPHRRVEYRNLIELVLLEAARPPDAASRFERDGQVIEARFEQLPGGEAIGLLVDVTTELSRHQEIQRDREALLHEERMHAMGVLASGVSHDLNHALHIIALRIATLRADPQLESAKRPLEKLSHVVEDAARVVARLQDLARKRRDRPTDPLDLAAVLTGAVEMARTEAELADVRIEADVPPLPLVRGSAAELAHVFGSLLHHAFVQMREGGVIRVRALAEEAGRVAVTIRGAGANLHEEDLSRLFDPLSGVAGETALGLSVAWGVMSRLGGQLLATSRDGEGTCFTLLFPVAAPPPKQLPRPPNARVRKRRRILLIDDETDNLEVLREVLELEGHEVRTARSGPEALARIGGGEPYDLVLCDVGMPEMSGWEVAKQIGRLAPRTAVWMLTGWANEIADADPRRKLASGVLGKPLDLERLRSVLASPLRSAQPALQ